MLLNKRTRNNTHIKHHTCTYRRWIWFSCNLFVFFFRVHIADLVKFVKRKSSFTRKWALIEMVFFLFFLDFAENVLLMSYSSFFILCKHWWYIVASQRLSHRTICLNSYKTWLSESECTSVILLLLHFAVCLCAARASIVSRLAFVLFHITVMWCAATICPYFATN